MEKGYIFVIIFIFCYILLLQFVWIFVLLDVGKFLKFKFDIDKMFVKMFDGENGLENFEIN